MKAASRLESFHPGSFGAVIGTAIVGVAGFQNPGQVSWMAPVFRGIGQAFTAFAAVLGAVLAVPYVVRWFLHPRAVLHELNDPVVGALYATFPGGILVLAATVAAVGPSLISAGRVHALVVVLACIGVPLAFGFSVLFAFLLFVPDIAPEAVNGGWFIPPVVNIVVPMVLTSLVTTDFARDFSDADNGLLCVLGNGVLAVHPRPLDALWPAFPALAAACRARPFAVDRTGASRSRCAHPAQDSPGGRQRARTGRQADRFALPPGCNGAVGIRGVVVPCRVACPGAISATWWASLRRGLVGLHLPPWHVHDRDARLAHGWKSGLLEDIGAALFVLLVVFWVVVAARTLWAVRTGEVWQSAVKAPTIAEPGVLVRGTR